MDLIRRIQSFEIMDLNRIMYTIIRNNWTRFHDETENSIQLIKH